MSFNHFHVERSSAGDARVFRGRRFKKFSSTSEFAFPLFRESYGERTETENVKLLVCVEIEILVRTAQRGTRRDSISQMGFSKLLSPGNDVVYKRLLSVPNRKRREGRSFCAG